MRKVIMRLKFVIVCYVIIPATCYAILTDYHWLYKFYKVGKMFFKKCSRDVEFSNVNDLKNCITSKSLLILDDFVNNDSIEILNGLSLLKRNNSKFEFLNYRRTLKYHLNQAPDDWFSVVLEKISRLFQSHVLRVNIANLAEPRNGVGRGKHGHQMSSVIVFSLIAAGMVMAPLGFKFLVVLGTKALLLAMMAMILTSIQGLKKIATSKLNYGLYETQAHNPCQYDRRWYYNNRFGNATIRTDDAYDANYEFDEHRILDPRDSEIKRLQTTYMT